MISSGAVALLRRPGSKRVRTWSCALGQHAHRDAGRLGRLAELAQAESFIARVLGTDCYTAALAAVNGDCRSLGHEQKTRLALAFSNCHLRKLGKRTYACTERMSLQHCVDHDDTVCLLCTHQSSSCGPCLIPLLLLCKAIEGPWNVYSSRMCGRAGVLHHPHAVLCRDRQV